MKENEREDLLKTESEVDTTGKCIFCGQMRAVQVPESWTEEDTDEYVTEICGCKDAQEQRKRKKRKENIVKAVDATFMESGGTYLPESVTEMLKQAAELIEIGELDQIQVKFEGVTGTICEGKDGTIKVIGTKKLENGMEV